MLLRFYSRRYSMSESVLKLVAAIKNKDRAKVKRLLERGVDVNGVRV